MIKITNLHLPLNFNKNMLTKISADKLKINENNIKDICVSKKSVDARDKRDIHFVIAADVTVNGNEKTLVAKRKNRDITILQEYKYQPVECKGLSLSPVVVGFGPAGMMAALILAQAGQKPIVIERGQAVEKREETVNKFWKSAKLSENSNVQFGEGGAGTFSDGKLTTGTKDVRIRKVLEEFVNAGAPNEILYDAKPHIGTDKLPQMVKNIRNEIIKLGGKVYFESKLTDFSLKDGQISSVTIEKENGLLDKIECNNLILAIGHSARDTFEFLNQKKIVMQAKPFSVGARIEHKREMIDKAQYGEFVDSPFLGAADYKLSHRLADGRGVYTFCMCPGGYVTGAASEKGCVVTNGMSKFARNAENSNSALLVGVSPDDFGNSPLDGIEFQRKIERAAFENASSSYAAPAQTVGDFLKGNKSTKFGNVKPTYEPGVSLGDISSCLPNFVVNAMKEGISRFSRRLSGFDNADAILTAPETRSSSPVRILRDEGLQSISVLGLYPCGEGAGYAGGITSAAVDGIRCAEKILEKG